jgi:hypothetical protein
MMCYLYLDCENVRRGLESGLEMEGVKVAKER